MGTLFIGMIVLCVVGLAAYKVFQDSRSVKKCGGCYNCACCSGRRKSE